MVFWGMFTPLTAPEIYNPNKYTMNKFKTLLIAGSALAFASLASAAIVEQWNFDSPSNGTGINGTIISTWDATAANNTDLGGGILRFGNSTTSNFTSSQLLPDIDTSAISTMTWTFELADVKLSAGSHFRFTTITSGAGVPEIELTAFGTGPSTFSPDMEYNVNTDKLDAKSGLSLSGAGGTLGGPLTIVATWDFVNNTMTLDMGGLNVSTITPAANMAASIGTITGFQMRSQSFVAGDYLDMDSFTIETTAVPEPSTFALLAGLATLGLVMYRRRRLSL
jgi:hypothetical protein